MADANGLFWNSVNGDRTYDADSFAEWLTKFFTNGVFNGELQVTEDTGMTVNVSAGYANINGKVKFFEQAQSFTLDPASGVYPRIDTIVVRCDTTNRTITTEYVKGEYSGQSPTATEPTRSGGLYELVLAQISVEAGATSITASDITDTRADSELCGWVTGTVDSVDVEQLTEQAQAKFELWFEHMQGQLTEDVAGNLQTEVDTLAGSIASFEYATAQNAHAVGDYLILDNQVYKVISAITAGDTLTVGTNIEATSAGNELKTVNDSIDALNDDLMSYNYAGASTVSSGAISAGSSRSYTVTGKGLVSFTNMLAHSSSSDCPYVRISVNGSLIFETQGFYGSAKRAGGPVLPVKSGDVIKIDVYNVALDACEIRFIPKL